MDLLAWKKAVKFTKGEIHSWQKAREENVLQLFCAWDLLWHGFIEKMVGLGFLKNYSPMISCILCWYHCYIRTAQKFN